MTTNYPIDINKASTEDPLTIKGIGEKIAKTIIAKHILKGILMLQDLKTNPNNPSKLWNILFDQGIIKIESLLQQTNIDQTQTDTTNTDKQNPSTETVVTQTRGKDQNYSVKCRLREEVIDTK
jgi:hypothetical protein